MTAQYQLVMHSGPTPGKVFPMEGDVIIIGRESENNIVINDAEVSRKHTQFVFQGGKFIVTDLGSTNGTFVNGQRLTGQHVMQPGEIISLGEQINLLFESITQVDPNATMLSGGHAPAMPRTAAAVPQSRPMYQSAPPPPVYAGQVPSGPAYASMSPAPVKANNSRMIMIIAIVMVVCVVCGCVGLGLYIDNAKLWCSSPVSIITNLFFTCPPPFP